MDKVTRVSVINEYEEGGLKMIDLDSMIKSLRLAWLKRIFNGNNGTWKSYLQYLLEPMGGCFFLNCNYDKKITKSPLSSTVNYCYGGRISAILSLQRMSGRT